MYPEIHIGPLTLQTFGICFAFAFIAAGALIWRRLGELGKPVDWAYEMGFSALVGGLVGSRLDFIIENYSDVKHDLLGNLFSGSGLVWYGGAIGGAIGVFLWAWWRGFLTLALLDLAAPGAGPRLRDRPLRLPALRRRRLRQGLERALGDGLSRRHQADRPDRPPDAGLRDADDGPRRPRALAAPRPLHRTARLFALYLLLAGTERFLVEFIRRNDDVALGLTQAQLISVAMMIAGGVWLLLASARDTAPPGARPSATARAS